MESANSLLMRSLYAVADTGKRAYKLLNIERQQPGAKGSGRSPSLVTQTADTGSVSELFEDVKSEDKSFRPKESSEVADREGHPIQKGAPQKLEHNDIWWITVNEID